MSIELKGLIRKKLREGLKSGFSDFETLNRFSKEVLNYDLKDRTDSVAGMDTVIDSLMTVMHEQGKVIQLIEAARQERPKNSKLRDVEQDLKLTFNPFSDLQLPFENTEYWKSSGPESIVTASVGFSSMEDFLTNLSIAEFRVCTLSYGISGGSKIYGTAFLVGEDLLITNEHVIRKACSIGSPITLSGNVIEAAFDYRNMHSNKVIHKLAESNWLIAFDPEIYPDGRKGLDYAILRLASKVGSDPIGTIHNSAIRGYFKSIAYSPVINEPILILQHPFDNLTAQQSPMKLTIGVISANEELEIQHSANTLTGSSGSPVFNSRMELIGLHHFGDVGFNIAKKISAIKNDLKIKSLSDLLQ